MVLEQSKTAFKLDVSFIRPMEASTMTMVKPAAFYVVEDGRKTDLKETRNTQTNCFKELFKEIEAQSRSSILQ